MPVTTKNKKEGKRVEIKTPCERSGHAYKPYRDPFYAKDLVEGVMVKNKSIVLQTFYCEKCADITTKTVVNYLPTQQDLFSSGREEDIR